MQVWIVVGYNGIVQKTGGVGVSATKEGAERIARENEWRLDASSVQGPFDVEDEPDLVCASCGDPNRRPL